MLVLYPVLPFILDQRYLVLGRKKLRSDRSPIVKRSAVSAKVCLRAILWNSLQRQRQNKDICVKLCCNYGNFELKQWIFYEIHLID